jgi:hypothetical protein
MTIERSRLEADEARKKRVRRKKNIDLLVDGLAGAVTILFVYCFFLGAYDIITTFLNKTN